MSSQSWAAWLLDSYASSVSHLPSDAADRKDDETGPVSDGTPATSSSQPSSAMSLGSNSSPISPSGPYTRTGRGGAGNFHWHANRDDQSNDVEAQKPTSLAERRKAAAKLERIQTGQAMARRAVSSPYLHVGRGGAGNYTQSNEVQVAQSPRSASTAYASTPTVGRGGQGNMAVAMDAKHKAHREKEEKELHEAEKRREQIEQQVAAMLQPPPGAVLASASRRSSMILEDG